MSNYHKHESESLLIDMQTPLLDLLFLYLIQARIKVGGWKAFTEPVV